MEEIEMLRKKIDKIDDEIVKLYTARLSLTEQIGKLKLQNAENIEVPFREKEIIERLTKKLGEEEKENVERLYYFIFTESKNLQTKIIEEENK